MPQMFEYVQQLKHLKINIDDIPDILEKRDTVKKYLYIIHDKDKDVEPHIHIMGNCRGSNVSFKDVAKWFNDEPQRVEYIKCGKWSRAVLYLIHGGNNDKDKYQYDISELRGNYDFTNEINKAKQYEENHKDKMTLENYCRKVIAGELPFYNPEKYLDDWDILNDKGLIKKSYDEYVRRLIKKRKGGSMNMNVIFVYGAPGSGKDVFAETFAQGVGDGSMCISSSKNDTMQDYAGENTLILSDLRDTTFEFDTLLKILDNHVPSSVHSRYNNKYFIGDYIIITSAVDLFDWYKNCKEDKNQLFRRIGTYIRIEKDKGIVKQYNVIPYEDRLKYDDDDIINPVSISQCYHKDNNNFYKVNYLYRCVDIFSYKIVQDAIDLKKALNEKDTQSVLKVMSSSLEHLKNEVDKYIKKE